MSGLLWNTAALSTESSQPPYGPAPAPLDGPELPSFRYSLGAQKTEQFNGGTAKEANVLGDGFNVVRASENFKAHLA